MKLVINDSFGGFCLPDGFCEEYGIKSCYDDSVKRFDERLVSYVETHEEGTGSLLIVEVPDEASDYMITEYDGLESVIYVLNGKLHRI